MSSAHGCNRGCRCLAWLTSRCSLRGEALRGVVVGQPASLLLHTQDRFGNSRAAGGEDVDVELSGPAGKLLELRVPPFIILASITLQGKA